MIHKNVIYNVYYVFQMSTLAENPFKSDPSALNINGPITSLQFTDEDEKILPVENLPSGGEIEFFVPQTIPPLKVIKILYSQRSFSDNSVFSTWLVAYRYT